MRVLMHPRLTPPTGPRSSASNTLYLKRCPPNHQQLHAPWFALSTQILDLLLASTKSLSEWANLTALCRDSWTDQQSSMPCDDHLVLLQNKPYALVRSTLVPVVLYHGNWELDGRDGWTHERSSMSCKEHLILIQNKPDRYKVLVLTALMPVLLFYGNWEGKNNWRIVWESASQYLYSWRWRKITLISKRWYYDLGSVLRPTHTNHFWQIHLQQISFDCNKLHVIVLHCLWKRQNVFCEYNSTCRICGQDYGGFVRNKCSPGRRRQDLLKGGGR